MEENASQQKWYGFTIMFIYVFIALDWWLHTFSHNSVHHPIVRVLMDKLWKIPVLAHPIHSHLLVIGLIAVVSWAAKGRKDIAFEPWRQVVLPGGLGLGLMADCVKN